MNALGRGLPGSGREGGKAVCLEPQFSGSPALLSLLLHQQNSHLSLTLLFPSVPLHCVIRKKESLGSCCSVGSRSDSCDETVPGLDFWFKASSCGA